MKLSHILIKVKDLDKAVKEWEDKGFIVEYGKSKNPYNALIYFADGPFIELFKFNGLPRFLRPILKAIGKVGLFDKMAYWGSSDEGLLSIMLENYEDNLNTEANILKQYNIGGSISKKNRMDTKNRNLKFTVMFTDGIYFPDLMTYFSTDPKPKTNEHPNGIKGVASITLGLDKHQEEAFKAICDDERIIIERGSGIKNLVWID